MEHIEFICPDNPECYTANEDKYELEYNTIEIKQEDDDINGSSDIKAEVYEHDDLYEETYFKNFMNSEIIIEDEIKHEPCTYDDDTCFKNFMNTDVKQEDFTKSEFVLEKSITLKSGNIKRLPKTTAERCREYRARKRALKLAAKVTEKTTVKRKTSSERVREYRARQKAMKLAAKAAGISVEVLKKQKINNKLAVIETEINGDKSVRPKTSTERGREYRARLMSKDALDPNIKEHAIELVTIDSDISSEIFFDESIRPKTSAERSREYRARQKAIMGSQPRRKKRNTLIKPKTPAERSREYRARQKKARNTDTTIDFEAKDVLVKSECSQTDVKPKSSVERVRAYRARQKALRLAAKGLKADVCIKPKTTTERVREYRARQKALKLAALDTEKSTLKPKTEGVREYRVKQKARKLAATNTETTMLKRPKTATERVREYRARQKALKLAAMSSETINNTLVKQELFNDQFIILNSMEDFH